MRIDSCSNKPQRTSFGYNRILNEQLVTKLDKTPSRLSDAIRSLNTFCNDTEDRIDNIMPSNCVKTDVVQLVKLFIDTKKALVEQVEKLFPVLDFRIQESANYHLEYRAGKEWKKYVSNALSDTDNALLDKPSAERPRYIN